MEAAAEEPATEKTAAEETAAEETGERRHEPFQIFRFEIVPSKHQFPGIDSVVQA